MSEDYEDYDNCIDDTEEEYFDYEYEEESYYCNRCGEDLGYDDLNDIDFNYTLCEKCYEKYYELVENFVDNYKTDKKQEYTYDINHKIDIKSIYGKVSLQKNQKTCICKIEDLLNNGCTCKK